MAPERDQNVALKNEGIDRLIDLLFEHRRHLESNGRLAERLARNEFHFFRQLVLDMAATVLLKDSRNSPLFRKT